VLCFHAGRLLELRARPFEIREVGLVTGLMRLRYFVVVDDDDDDDASERGQEAIS
jgi:hypothetical protein